MKHAELFAGYGGLSLAVEEVFNAELAWYSEWEDAPSRIMARHWPGAPNYGDVTAIDWNSVEPVEIISGGFPCQDVSMAGRRAGMNDGTRSNLWGAMRTAIETIRLTFVVAENVRGLLSATAHSASELEPDDRLLGDRPSVYLRALGRVLGDLTDLGYDAEWRTIRASDVGAPHRRERVFILAWRRDVATGNGHGGRAGRGTPAPGESQGRGQDVTPRISGGASSGTGAAEPVALLPTPSANLGSNGGSQHPEKRRAGGHSIQLHDAVEHLLPTPRATRGGSTTETMYLFGGERSDGGRTQGEVLLPTPKAGDAEFGLPRTSGRPPGKSTHLATRLAFTDWGDYAPAISRWERATGHEAPPPTELSARGSHRLSPRFTEWMQGLPPGWICDTPGVSRNEAIKAAGNGVVPQQAAAGLRQMINHLPAPLRRGFFMPTKETH